MLPFHVIKNMLHSVLFWLCKHEHFKVNCQLPLFGDSHIPYQKRDLADRRNANAERDSFKNMSVVIHPGFNITD